MSDSESLGPIGPGAYGDAIGLHFGLKDRPRSVAANDLGRISLAVTRLRCSAGRLATAPLPPERAVIVIVHLHEAVGQQLWLQGRPLSAPRTLAAGTVQIIDLRCKPAWRFEGPFDCLHLYVPHAALERLAAERGYGQGGALTPFSAIEPDDAVLRHLATCFLHALKHPRETSRSYIEHLALALHTHLARTCYEFPLASAEAEPQGLATWQQRVAMEAMLDDIARGFEVAEVATKCRMSVAHFRRAFRSHTGQTPYRWLTHRRVESARDLLKIRSVPLSEIALRCGFSDQSHFTRVFAQLMGSTPGAWRRTLC
jgi:AraC family transcriptional regulator